METLTIVLDESNEGAEFIVLQALTRQALMERFSTTIEKFSLTDVRLRYGDAERNLKSGRSQSSSKIASRNSDVEADAEAEANSRDGISGQIDVKRTYTKRKKSRNNKKWTNKDLATLEAWYFDENTFHKNSGRSFATARARIEKELQRSWKAIEQRLWAENNLQFDNATISMPSESMKRQKWGYISSAEPFYEE